MKNTGRSMSSPARKGKRVRRCPSCEKGQLTFVEDITTEIDGYTFIERGWRCGNCGEEFIPEEEGERMINVAKRLGIWGEPLKLRRKLSRSGRGTVLRIPIDIEQALRLKGNEEVLVSKAGRKIIVEVQD
jgi:transcriptional regulator NrdR family protein